MRKFAKPIVLSLAFAVSGAVAPGSSPEGFWLTGNKSAIIEIFRCAGDGTLCGSLVWFPFKAGDPIPLDAKNPDPGRRERPLCGLPLMSGFKPSVKPNSWEGGKIYDAESGDTYHASIKLQADGTLSLHGYIGIPLIGASEVWTRYAQPVPACPAR